MTEKNVELNRPRAGFAANPTGARLRTVVIGTGRVVEFVMHRACRRAGIGVSSGNTALQPSGDGFVATYQAAIWARDRKPSRARIRSTWDSAERSVMTSSSAICRFDQPCATSAAT